MPFPIFWGLILACGAIVLAIIIGFFIGFAVIIFCLILACLPVLVIWFIFSMIIREEVLRGNENSKVGQVALVIAIALSIGYFFTPIPLWILASTSNGVDESVGINLTRHFVCGTELRSSSREGLSVDCLKRIPMNRVCDLIKREPIPCGKYQIVPVKLFCRKIFGYSEIMHSSNSRLCERLKELGYK